MEAKGRRIQLSRGRVAVVDETDYPALAKHKWSAASAKGKWYATRSERVNGKRTTVYMQRHILELGPDDGPVWFKNENSLDLRRKNLTQVMPVRGRDKRRVQNRIARAKKAMVARETADELTLVRDLLLQAMVLLERASSARANTRVPARRGTRGSKASKKRRSRPRRPAPPNAPSTPIPQGV